MLANQGVTNQIFEKINITYYTSFVRSCVCEIQAATRRWGVGRGEVVFTGLEKVLFRTKAGSSVMMPSDTVVMSRDGTTSHVTVMQCLY